MILKVSNKTNILTTEIYGSNCFCLRYVFNIYVVRTNVFVKCMLASLVISHAL